MNEVLYDKICGEFGSIVAIAIIITLAIIAILKFGINFNLNEYLESRKKRHLLLARKYCPHMGLVARANNQIEIKSWLYSPSGTLDWVCSKCGQVMHVSPSEDEIHEKAEYYLSNPKAYIKQLKMYNKHAEKSM